MDIIKTVRAYIEGADDKISAINQIREVLHELSPVRSQPVDYVRWVPVEKVVPNDYNPNFVAANELRLLHRSIEKDGYTQPVVTIYDAEGDRYVIVDGFHRYTVMRTVEDVRRVTGGLLPVVVIQKSLEDRMAATVRHNRARGKHVVHGMANLVFAMLNNGMNDDEVCRELGLEADELVRLKYVTGFAKLFERAEYRRAWETKRQVQLRKKWKERQRENPDGGNQRNQAVLAKSSG